MRASFDAYFMDIAAVVASRATCPRKHVGAILVRDRIILSTGYNGSLPGRPHCEETQCVVEGGHCANTVHAEANAVAQAARIGTPVDGATLYTTASPCWPCFKLLTNAGVNRIVYGELYPDDSVKVLARAQGIEMTEVAHG